MLTLQEQRRYGDPNECGRSGSPLRRLGQIWLAFCYMRTFDWACRAASGVKREQKQRRGGAQPPESGEGGNLDRGATGGRGRARDPDCVY